MGRLELILGFRGCRRKMDMEAENTIRCMDEALSILMKIIHQDPIFPFGLVL